MLKRIISAAVLSVASVAVPVAAQTSSDRVLLRGATVLDTITGQARTGQVVAVEDGKIAYVGDEQSVPNIANYRIIEMNGATLLPGLSDSHVHLTSRADQHGYKRLAVSDQRAAITGVLNAQKTLMAGFTTVRNLGAPGYADVALRDAIDAGDVAGPRMLVSGPSIGITGGHCDNNLLPFQYGAIAEGVADGPWAVRQKVRQNFKYGANVIKFCGTGGVLSKGTKIGAQQFTLEEMTSIVDEAHALGMKVAVHAHGTRGIRTALEAGVDSVEHASLIDDESIAIAKRNGTYLSMDIYVSDYILAEGEAVGILEESLAKERIVGQRQRERFKAAIEGGANIAFGSDAGVYPHGTNGRQFAYMVQWGLTPMQAIQASTIGNARLFGMDEQIGSITVGKHADMIAVDGNPLSDIRELEDVDFVMKGGRVYRNKLSR